MKKGKLIRDSLSDYILHCIDPNPVEGKNSNDKNIVAHWEAFLFAQIKPDHEHGDEDDCDNDGGDGDGDDNGDGEAREHRRTGKPSSSPR